MSEPQSSQRHNGPSKYPRDHSGLDYTAQERSAHSLPMGAGRPALTILHGGGFNPIPSGAVTTVISAKDVQLRTARWPATQTEKHGTVCVFTGRAECIEKYFETVSDLRRRGFAVAILDWRGQGGSQRLLKNPRKGHVEDFSDYQADLRTFMHDIVLPDCPPPYYAMAHSMGGAVLLQSAVMSNCWFERIFLSAPMLQLENLPMGEVWTGVATEVANFSGRGDAFVPGQQRSAEAAENMEFEVTR